MTPKATDENKQLKVASLAPCCDQLTEGHLVIFTYFYIIKHGDVTPRFIRLILNITV